MGLGWWSQPNGRRRPGGRGRQQGYYIREFRVVGGDGCGPRVPPVVVVVVGDAWRRQSIGAVSRGRRRQAEV
jgi:hypothetical protein